MVQSSYIGGTGEGEVDQDNGNSNQSDTWNATRPDSGSYHPAGAEEDLEVNRQKTLTGSNVLVQWETEAEAYHELSGIQNIVEQRAVPCITRVGNTAWLRVRRVGILI